MIAARVNWWLSALVLISLATWPWWFTGALLATGVFGFKRFTLALPLAFFADLIYGAPGQGPLGFPFWFFGAVLLLSLARTAIRRFLTFPP